MMHKMKINYSVRHLLHNLPSPLGLKHHQFRLRRPLAPAHSHHGAQKTYLVPVLGYCWEVLPSLSVNEAIAGVTVEVLTRFHA